MVGGVMRKKSLACKTRLRGRSTSTPGPVPLPNPIDEVAAERDYAPDSCDDGDKSEETDRGSPDISSQEMTELHGLENHRCIKCDKVGKTLVCTEIGCPIAIHEECLIPKANFDDSGNFYCPYCLYKRAVAKVERLWKKAVSAKQELSKFLNVAVVDGGEKEHDNKKRKKKTVSAPHVKIENQHDDDISVVNVVSSENMKKRKRMQRVGKEDGESTKRDAVEFNSAENVENERHESHSESLTRGSQDMEHNDNVSLRELSTRLRERSNHEKQVVKVSPSQAKRKRLNWTIEEEEMLKEAVQKFSITHKNLPWRKILEFGSHVFHRTRAPRTLQDKWKNMTRKL